MGEVQSAIGWISKLWYNKAKYKYNFLNVSIFNQLEIIFEKEC